jgi:hypothetical protein
MMSYKKAHLLKKKNYNIIWEQIKILMVFQKKNKSNVFSINLRKLIKQYI